MDQINTNLNLFLPLNEPEINSVLYKKHGFLVANRTELYPSTYDGVVDPIAGSLSSHAWYI